MTEAPRPVFRILRDGGFLVDERGDIMTYDSEADACDALYLKRPRIDPEIVTVVGDNGSVLGWKQTVDEPDHKCWSVWRRPAC